MVLMRHLTTLHLTVKLSKEYDLWFRVPKLKEELYDLENDPFELNNLSNKFLLERIKIEVYKNHPNTLIISRILEIFKLSLVSTSSSV